MALIYSPALSQAYQEGVGVEKDSPREHFEQVRVEVDKKSERIEGRLSRNRGAAYPLQARTRDGITSDAMPRFLDALYEIEVIGAERGRVYQVAYFQNGQLLNGANAYNWQIRSFDAANFETNSAAGSKMVVSYSDPGQPQLDPAGGVQTIALQARPEYGRDVVIKITVDPAYLGTGSIDSNSVDTRPGWSWIIDPATYVYAGGSEITANSGKWFPFQKKTRGGVTSVGDNFLRDAVLDVRVVGAREGCFYRLAYFKNGTTAFSGPQDGWIIDEVDASTFETDGTSRMAVYYTDAGQPDIVRGGIQSIRIVSSRITGVEFYITLDTDRLPAFGTPVHMNQSGRPGWSWIIDPAKYEYPRTGGAAASGQALSWTLGTDGVMRAVWQSGSGLMRLSFGPNGFNGLPNIISLERAAGTNRGAAAWTMVSTTGTDWLPPLTVRAAANGDGSSIIYTGGNHGSDGSAGGTQTARNVLYKVFVDGQNVPVGAAASGAAQMLSFMITNEMMGYDTAGRAGQPVRYIVRQSFAVDIHPGGIEVSAETQAIEGAVVTIDNGPQTVTTGFQGDLLFLAGQYEAPQAFDSALTAGLKSAYPDAWAVVFSSADGQMMTWMDRTYGVGDGSLVASDRPMIRGGGAGNTKFYHAAIAGVAKPLAQGEAYRWRGGYAWQAAGLAPAADQRIATIWRGGQMVQVIARTGSDVTALPSAG